MKYYAVIDTNVLVSAALKWESVPGSIIELAFAGIIIPVLNDRIINEYRQVLLRPRFHLDQETVDSIIHGIRQYAVCVEGEASAIELPDEKDRVFYEVVMEERRDEDAYLVTGNIKHFPVERFIVTPRQMLNIILGSESDERNNH
ncbi:MAG: putative toxin-antitoxin system toxin component, PIN family [bacterium]|nr:putative toxin-antitoxin system toxin component, PIN family [bacterium]